jgi:hypothetical protein
MICQNTIKAHLNSHQTHNSHTRSYRPRKLLWQDSRKIVSWILIKEWESDCFYVPKHCFVEVKNGACKWSLEKRWGLTPHTCLVHHLWWFQWRSILPFSFSFCGYHWPVSLRLFFYIYTLYSWPLLPCRLILFLNY